MTRERIGVGVVGVGMMGRRHEGHAARSIPEARLAAVFDAVRALAGRVGREIDADACGSLEELLERSDVRVVVIASPRRFHAEQAIGALSRGKDVLLEKPMGLSLEECDRIIAAAKHGQSRLQIGFMRRYDLAYAEATALVGQHPRSQLAVYTRDGATRDLFPGFLERFADAYRAELSDFVSGVAEHRPPAVSGLDGRAAVAAALAGVASYESGKAEAVATTASPPRAPSPRR